MTSLAGYVHVCTYRYTTPTGEYLFGKQRWELLDPLSGQRSKTFRYWDPVERRQRKPPHADSYLYRLHEVMPAIAAGRTIHSVEGEKDADALTAAGEIATTHHQGAGRFTIDQATWLRDAEKIVLWVDRDAGHWEVGAYDAVLRCNRLLQVGVPRSAISFVRARGHGAKDTYDHLRRFTVAEAVPVDVDKLVEVARRYTPSARRMIGY